MKWPTLLAAACALELCPVLFAQDAKEVDRAKLQGTWVCEGSLDNGKEAPKYLGIRAVIDGDRLTWHYPRKDGSFLVKGGMFRIDPSQQPKHFDWWYHESSELVDRRLYSATDDTLRWSTNLDHKTTKTRPASFEAGRFQFTMKRQNEAPMLGTAIDPDGDCTLALDGSKLKIQVPAGRHDLWYGFKRMNAPRMLRAVSGDFTAQVKVTSDWTRPSVPFYHGAGLFVWDSPKQYLRLERNQMVNNQSDTLWQYTTPLYDVNDTRVNKWKSTKSDFFKGSSTWLRLERRGETITTWISHDGREWTETEKLTTHFPARVSVGIAALSFSNAPFTVEFEDFAVRQK